MRPCDPSLVVLLTLSFACRTPPSSPSVARPFSLLRFDVANLKCLPVRHWWGVEYTQRLRRSAPCNVLSGRGRFFYSG
ncbi:hypothetical protein PF005_g18040 [Phytophthora fragariae]|uniref:RxLR effector protein n=1 Tax=Phytophthora fragariae TaxID=53985 RepID=A0A6A3RHF7_9STRA|nr:hypothetical protein PF003_g15628 [Phytophthora fragariae]KAE8900505.1 hypothetical protein PF003_g15632 [Phytophthora fragariae]KAE8931731.1 hypothetical protein PF009_g18206 [Phytophthora fragariae]KAE8931738.1 hypothetical protein PF009_g18210 [Phytophthora fragariae]KAE9096309.1 hypothetical protein PF007_g17048 [Phytophthora fragariae]